MLKTSKVAESKPRPEEVGFIFNKDGEVSGLNPNTFSRYITKKITLRFSPEELFYEYKNGVFLLRKEAALKAMLYRIVNSIVPDSWRSSFETQYLQALQNRVYSAEGMNHQKNMLNLSNCMLDINNMKTCEHDPAFKSTIRIPLAYDPSAQCPRFKQFLEEVFDGDKERITIAEEIMGYCLTAETKGQKAFLLYGSGSNGKSVFCEVLRQLCGTENVSSVSLNEMKNSFARLDLVNKTVNLVTETEVNGTSFNTEFFKAIVAGDPIRTEVKHGPSFTITPTVKIVAAMNTLPFAKDQTYGLTRRLLILPFEKQFVGKEIDVNLLDELKKEMAGIFNLAIKGLKRLRKQEYRFTQSSKVDAELKEYQETISPITAFVDEMIVESSKESRVRNKVLRRLFGVWCKDRGHNKIAEMSENRFHSLLKNALRDRRIEFGSEKSGGERYVSGIELNVTGKSALEKIPGYAPSKLKIVTDMSEFDPLEEE